MVQGDSQLVVQQILGVYKVRSPNLQPLHKQAHKLLMQFDEYSLSHIDRALNVDADALANRAMDTCSTQTDTSLHT
jgi:ribonuclease HI